MVVWVEQNSLKNNFKLNQTKNLKPPSNRWFFFGFNSQKNAARVIPETLINDETTHF
jgi:hypothetical protein